MANPITWKNIQSTVNSPTNSFATATDQITSGFDPLTDALEKQQQRQTANAAQMRTNKKNDYINMFENAQSIDELEKLRGSGRAREMREEGGFDVSQVMGAYGQRAQAINSASQNTAQVREQQRIDRETPVVNEFNRRLQTEGSDAATNYIESLGQGSVSDMGSLYGAAEQYDRGQQEWQMRQNQEARQAASFAESSRLRGIQIDNAESQQEAREKREAALNNVSSIFEEMMGQRERNVALDHVAERNLINQDSSLPVDEETGGINWDAFNEEDAELAQSLRENKQSMMAESGAVELSNQTDFENMVSEHASEVGLNAAEQTALQQDARAYWTAQTNLAPDQQETLNTNLESVDSYYQPELDRIDQQIKNETQTDFNGQPIDKAAIETLNRLKDTSEEVDNSNFLAGIFGGSNASQFDQLQDAVLSVATQPINTEEGMVDVPDFVQSLAMQKMQGRLKTSGNIMGKLGASFNDGDTLADQYRKTVEEMMAQNADKIKDAVNARAELRMKKYGIEQERNRERSAAEAEIYRNNDVINTRQNSYL